MAVKEINIEIQSLINLEDQAFLIETMVEDYLKIIEASNGMKGLSLIEIIKSDGT